MSYQIKTIDDIGRIAKMMAMSCYFDAKGKDETAIAKISTQILAGQELGLGPFEAVQSLHIIQGKPCMAANLMAAAVKSHPRYNYHIEKLERECVEIHFYENDECVGISGFTLNDAVKAETGKMIAPGAKASMLDRFSRNMLFSRAISNGVRWFCPDVFRGGAVYTPDELGGKLDDDGFDFIDIEVTQKGTDAQPDIKEGPGEKPVTQEESLIIDKTQRIFHALGMLRYDGVRDEWDKNRKKATVSAGNKRNPPVNIESSKYLTEREALELITVLEDRIREKCLKLTEYDSDYGERLLDIIATVTERRCHSLDDVKGMWLIEVHKELCL